MYIDISLFIAGPASALVRANLSTWLLPAHDVTFPDVSSTAALSVNLKRVSVCVRERETIKQILINLERLNQLREGEP